MESYYKRKRDDGNIEGPSSSPVHEHEASGPELEALLPLVLVEVEQPAHSQNEEPYANEHVIFRGIDFLERDPALRPQIWQYPENVRDEVRRAYLQLGPMQPKLKKYNPSGPQGHQRRFQFSWFNNFPWLEYSESNHSAYCFFCFLCSKNIKNRSGFDVYTAQGFDGWKRVNNGKKCAFLAHIGAGPCSQHNNAVRDCQALLNQSNHISTIIEVQSNKDREKDRLRLRTSVATVKWLTFQSCAFRGHDETPESRNRGNYIEMLKLLGEFNPEIAAFILENSPHCSKYISHEIQQEILSIYAKKVRDHIRREIGDSKFSILVDETCDASKREQMALVFRFVDKDGVLQERFFQLIHVRNTKALTLKKELCAELSKHSFDVKNLRGQGYDGASNMKGEFNGLQALFLKDCPYAYYVHCYAHRLQLALVAAAKDVVPVSQFFQKLLFIINTVDSSSKRHDELNDAQVVEMSHLLAIGQIETGKGANQIKALKRPGDTRWGSHLGSVSSLMDIFKPVNRVLQLIASDATAGTHRADGDTAFKYLTNFEFVFVLCMMREILGISEELGKALQKKSQDIVNAIRLVSSTRSLLERMRSDEGWEYFFLQVCEFCTEHDVDIPDMNGTYILRGGRARRQPDYFTREQYFRVEIFRATLDSQLHELNLKFNEKVMCLLSISANLIPKNGFISFNAKDICKMVEKFYPADFTPQDMVRLEHQLNHFALDASSSEDLKNLTTLTTLCRCLVVTKRQSIYNLLDRLIRLLVTLPVSTASAERAFSSLKIIKTRLRNKMEDEYLANSLLVQIEREITAEYSYEDIMADFKARKTRRATL